MMKKILTVIGVALFAASLASAAPCNTGANVLTLGTCEFGGLTFSNWQVSEAGFNSAVLYFSTASDVVGNSVNVHFQLTHDPLAVISTGADIFLSYMVTGGLVNGVDLNLLNAFGSVGIIENVCADNPSDGCQTSLAQLSVINGVNFYDQQTFSGGPYSPIWVTKDLQFLTGARLSDFVNSHETGAVPEPMTYLLMGSGLLALGLLRRKISKS